MIMLAHAHHSICDMLIRVNIASDREIVLWLEDRGYWSICFHTFHLAHRSVGFDGKRIISGDEEG